jgi:hypothetical protein
VREIGEIQAIDATSTDHVDASQHYAKRTIYTFNTVKTTARTGMALGIHCLMNQPHDSMVGRQMLRRNRDKRNFSPPTKNTACGYSATDFEQKASNQ